jgi:hypothetical protein
MIINFEQHPGKLIISYVNKEGNISYSQLSIPVSHQYIWVYSKQKSQSIPGVLSFDHKPVRRVASQFLSKNRIQEFLIDAGEDLIKHFYEQNFPNLYSCDIEVDVTDDGFAEPSSANNRINSIAWTRYPECTIFGLKKLS